jgi:hypothetical protein
MTPASTAPLGLALLGLLLGMRHATDPDHVIAVTAILSRERRIGVAARIGLVWGLGHTLTVLVVGAAIIIFKLGIPVRVGLTMEFAVAVALILLGLPAANTLMRPVMMRLGGISITAARTLEVHSHPHSHGHGIHRHPHAHVHTDAANLHAIAAAPEYHEHALPPEFMSAFTTRRPLLKSFAVGLVHGLAGSAAIALLVLGAIPQPLWATLYLAIFCAGTILGMALITTAIGAPLMLSSRIAYFHSTLVAGSGLLSFGFGLFLAYQIGVVDHLFSSFPLWTPR